MPNIATSILVNNENEVLILKRSNKVRTYKGMWGGIAGYVEKGEEPFDTAIKEIREEASLEQKDVVFLKSLDPFEFVDFIDGLRYDWNIYTFLFKTEKKDKVHIDWEHTEYRWINPSKLGEFDTVPHLKEVIFKLLM